jgi:conjugal transfer pilin signal peptidase TrbI
MYASLAQRTQTLAIECGRSISRHAVWWVAAIALFVGVTQFVKIGVNVTESLPERVFIIVKGAPVHKGDYAVYRWHGGGPYQAGAEFTKIIAGVSGDRVEERNRAYYVNGQPVGVAKTVSRKGVPLEAGPTGVIPAGQYYMMTPHPDSLDSRYALTGWIQKGEIIGRAYAIF